MQLPVYLDYSATTPVDPRVAAAMIPFLCERYGNPASRSHAYGRDAEAAVEAARQDIASVVGCDARERARRRGDRRAVPRARPRNVGAFAPGDDAVGTGHAGAPGGDVVKLEIKVGAGGAIADTRFRAQGNPAAIACASLASEWPKGRSLDAAAALGHAGLADALELQPERLHCSILACDAILAAVADYRRKHAGGEAAHLVE